MKLLLLIVGLTCALFHTAESLSCHVCSSTACTNTTTEMCPSTSTACITSTTVAQSGTSAPVTVVTRNCSTLLTCVTPLTVETEFSVNFGFAKAATTQICCATDNCNFQILATPTIQVNGKLCPACASAGDSLAGTCTSSLSCAGTENSCFNGTSTVNGQVLLRQGCVSRNLCFLTPALEAVFGTSNTVTCGAPWSVGISGLLLTVALAAHKALF